MQNKERSTLRIAVVGLFAGAALAFSPVVALADPGDGGDRPYPCSNGQFWYPQYNQCVAMCKPGFDHIEGPDSCDKIPTAHRVSPQRGWRSASA